jgi:hypothetical protein
MTRLRDARAGINQLCLNRRLWPPPPFQLIESSHALQSCQSARQLSKAFPWPGFEIA